jgi:hypothetical protein
MHDCKPCTGKNAVSEASLFASFTNINTSGKRIILDFFLLTNRILLLMANPMYRKQSIAPGASFNLHWQFDIWATLPVPGSHLIFQVAATSCSELSNHPNNIDSRVNENVISLMKEGKAFSFAKTNTLGATYTITGTPTE